MPYSKRICAACSREWLPHGVTDGDTCRSCIQLQRKENLRAFPYARKDCEVCVKAFQSKDGEKRCPECRRLAQTNRLEPVVEDHYLASPLRQAVFDLETFALDRGWGVVLMAVILVHGDGPEPKWYEFDITQTSKWPEVRSDDSELYAKIYDVLKDCHVLYAHNGAWFDIPYLNSVALKYNLPRLKAKLIDPVQIARRKYRIGSNSLSNVADFLGLPESKMHVGPDIWKNALLDNDPECWRVLRERCKSDVRLLNMVSGRVTSDVGMIDYGGSAYR